MSEDLRPPRKYSFSDPNTALRFKKILTEFADGRIDSKSTTDRYGYILDINNDGPEYPSANLEFAENLDANGNPIDPIVVENTLDNPTRATYARIITDDGFIVRARISPSQVPVFRKAEFFDKTNPSGEGVMVDERGVYVNVVRTAGVSSVHPTSYPWLIEQDGQRIVVEPQVAPRVHISGVAGSYYVVSVIRGVDQPRLDLEQAKQDIIQTAIELGQAKQDLADASLELEQVRADIEVVKTDLDAAEVELAEAKSDSAIARDEAAAATGEASTATQTSQDAWNKALEVEEAVQNVSDGADAIVLAVTSSNGTIFKSTPIATTLTARVYKGGVEQTGDALTALGTISWYKDGAATPVGTGPSLVLDAGQVTNKAIYEARLETA